MRAAFIVAKREFLERVKTKWFVVITLLGPLMMIGIIVIPALVATQGTAGTRVQIVDDSGVLGKPIADDLAKLEWTAEVLPPTPAISDDQLYARIASKQINAFLRIPKDALDGGAIVYRGDNASSQVATIEILGTISHDVQVARGARMGIRAEQLDALLKPANVDSKLSTGSTTASSGMGSFLVGYILAFILYLVITIYCVNVMRSVVQEKSSRVMELLVAVVRPRDLLAGKILGVGAAGLLQVTVWLVMAGVMLANKATVLGWFGMSGGGPDLPELGAGEILVVLVYFVVGFFFYASVFAALGAMVSSEQDTQQVQMPVTMVLLVGMLCLQVVSNDPRGSTAGLMTMIPTWSPMLMPMRYVLGGASLADVGISLAILLVSTALVIRAAAKIYRVGVLMYGKRPGVVEIIRWLRHP